jgi:hypothetical protein
LGKKLFHLGTEQSARLGIYDHVSRHPCPPPVRISILDNGRPALKRARSYDFSCCSNWIRSVDIGAGSIRPRATQP